MIFQIPFQGLDLEHLTGDEFLRLLLERNATLMRQWCPHCWGILVGEGLQEEVVRCPRCKAQTLPLDDHFWERKSRLIKQALDNDPQLLARVKAEVVARLGEKGDAELPYPVPKPLAWLEPLWKTTGRPKGRPFDPVTPSRVAVAVRRYEDMGLTLSEIEAIVGNHPLKSIDSEAELFSESERAHLLSEYEKLLGPLDPGKRKVLLEYLYTQFEQARSRGGDGLTRQAAFERVARAAQGWQFTCPGLTQKEIFDVLQAEEQVREREQDGRLTEDQRQALSEEFRKFVGCFFDRAELWRRLIWVEQQADPWARLRGERVRARGESTRPSRNWTLRTLRVPWTLTSYDQVRFMRVFLWVSQDGLTKEAAIEREAKVEGEEDYIRPLNAKALAELDRAAKREELWAALSAEERQARKDSIRHSLERVEENKAKIRAQLRMPIPDPQQYWQPGTRKDLFAKLFQASGHESEALRGTGEAGAPVREG